MNKQASRGGNVRHHFPGCSLKKSSDCHRCINLQTDKFVCKDLRQWNEIFPSFLHRTSIPEGCEDRTGSMKIKLILLWFMWFVFSWFFIIFLSFLSAGQGHPEWIWGPDGINKRLSALGLVAFMPCARPNGVTSRGVDGLEGSTLLNIAVRRQKLATVKALVEIFGADINIPWVCAPTFFIFHSSMLGVASFCWTVQ